MLLRVYVAAAERRSRLERAVVAAQARLVASEGEAPLLEQLRSQACDLVLLARADLPAFSPELVAEMGRLPDAPGVIVVSDREDPEERAELLAAGCLAVVYEGLADANLVRTLRSLLERHRDDRLHRLDAEAQRSPGLAQRTSQSPTMSSLLETARRVATTDSTLLLLGETGVGKEWLARCIHEEGPRAGAPFVAVNCGALPENLLESELFGHVRGAFTGASRSRRGHFELAHRGTLFLDEIAELPPHLQVKLLRALEGRRIQPVGSEEVIEVDVRLMAATNRILEIELHEGRFRSDLFYRLNVVSLTVPPLRERAEDIPALVHGFLEELRRRLRPSVIGIRPEVVEALTAWDWPGNVRELMNVVERLVLLCHGSEITLADLSGTGSAAASDLELGRAPAPGAPGGTGQDWTEQPWRVARAMLLERAERIYLSRLMARCGGRVGVAARSAGMDPRSLYEKLRRHGLRKESFRGPVAPAATHVSRR